MPDYASVHKELQRGGVTLDLLWLEYCDQCRAAGEIPYQSTQFNKYYADYLAKVNATMHLNHKPGEVTALRRSCLCGSRSHHGSSKENSDPQSKCRVYLRCA